jgi:hypothetical protein
MLEIKWDKVWLRPSAIFRKLSQNASSTLTLVL